MGGKGSGGMGGGDMRQMPGPWRMPTSWGMSPSSGLPGSFPAGPRFSAFGGFGGMGGYPGSSPWSGGPPWGSAMQQQGQDVSQQPTQTGMAPQPQQQEPQMQQGTGMTPPVWMGGYGGGFGRGYGGMGGVPPWLRGGMGNGMGTPPPSVADQAVPTAQAPPATGDATSGAALPPQTNAGGPMSAGLGYGMPWMRTGGMFGGFR